MCTFNGSRFLPDQLASFVAQTRRPDELVVSDDGSSDPTMEILEAFAATAPFPVRLHRNVTPQGVATNFSRAISLCEGSLVALSDQDDVWEPTKLERQVELLDRNPSLGGVFTDAALVDDQLESLGTSLFERAGFTPRRRYRFEQGRGLAMLLARPVVCGTTLAFRSSLRDLVLPIPSTGLHDVWLSVLLSATSELAAIPEPLVRYRQHAHNQVGAPAQGILGKFARRRAKGVFGDEVAHFAAMVDRLLAVGNEQPLELLREKVAHLRFRAELPASPFGPVVAELARGRYHRFSRGLTSATFDLLFHDRPEPLVTSESPA